MNIKAKDPSKIISDAQNDQIKFFSEFVGLGQFVGLGLGTPTANTHLGDKPTRNPVSRTELSELLSVL